MKFRSALILSLVGGLLAFCLSANAAPRQRSEIEYLRPADLSKAPNHRPGSAHGHVRQRLEYGKGFRYGHSVSGPLGNIVIWSAAPNQSHPSTGIMSPRGHQRPRVRSGIGPKLQYKAEYGKSTKPDYGD